ncbi:MAG: META domain-containing protein [Pseudomonadota bacterium]
MAGTILIPPALDVPQGAAMVVRIVNTRRGDGEAITLAEQRLAIAGPRTRYRLTYDRALVNAVGTYRVQVVILYAGDTLYLGNDRLPDPGSDRARELRITLREPPLRRGNSLRRLVERSWRGAVIFDEPLPNLVEAQLEFLRDGAVRGDTGCNRLNGRYAATGVTMRFGEMAITRRACSGSRREAEKRIMRALRETRGWILQGSELHLFDADGDLIAIYRNDI